MAWGNGRVRDDELDGRERTNPEMQRVRIRDVQKANLRDNVGMLGVILTAICGGFVWMLGEARAKGAEGATPAFIEARTANLKAEAAGVKATEAQLQVVEVQKDIRAMARERRTGRPELRLDAAPVLVKLDGGTP